MSSIDPRFDLYDSPDLARWLTKLDKQYGLQQVSRLQYRLTVVYTGCTIIIHLLYDVRVCVHPNNIRDNIRDGAGRYVQYFFKRNLKPAGV